MGLVLLIVSALLYFFGMLLFFARGLLLISNVPPPPSRSSFCWGSTSSWASLAPSSSSPRRVRMRLGRQDQRLHHLLRGVGPGGPQLRLLRGCRPAGRLPPHLPQLPPRPLRLHLQDPRHRLLSQYLSPHAESYWLQNALDRLSGNSQSRI